MSERAVVLGSPEEVLSTELARLRRDHDDLKATVLARLAALEVRVTAHGA